MGWLGIYELYHGSLGFCHIIHNLLDGRTVVPSFDHFMSSPLAQTLDIQSLACLISTFSSLPPTRGCHFYGSVTFLHHRRTYQF